MMALSQTTGTVAAAAATTTGTTTTTTTLPSPTIIPFTTHWNDTIITNYSSVQPYRDQSSVMPELHAQLMTTNILSTTLATTPFKISSTISPAHSVMSSWTDWFACGSVQIPLYATILLLAITGNALVILTLIQNRRMRTITNVFLLNLAVSDILLGVLCMPFTLVGTLLRDFVFGEIMCKFLPYLQASSVTVSAWTLVAISCERYYAIVHPLKSRRWQTLSHAYKLIALIWCGSLIFMSPIAVLSRLIPTSQGHHKCREDWPENSGHYERAYNLFLDGILLVLPLIMLGATYSLITRSLWIGMRTETAFKNNQTFDSTQSSNNLMEVYLNSNGTPSTRCPLSCNHQSRENIPWHQVRSSHCSHDSSMVVTSAKNHSPGLRRTNAEKSLQNKRRVIQMLFAVVLEFFICWTPLYTINTIALFNPQWAYQTFGYTAITYFQLLAYSSSCCNPITYCFMNRGFRKAFLNLFRCFKRFHRTSRRMSNGTIPGPGTTVIVGNDTKLNESGVHRSQTQRPKPIACDIELSVINCMSSIDSTSKPKINETQLTATVKNNDNNKINSENQNGTK